MSKRHLAIHLPMFRYQVFCYFGYKPLESQKAFEKKYRQGKGIDWDNPSEFSDRPAIAWEFPNNGISVVYFQKSKPSNFILNHEMGHVVMNLFRYIGLKHVEETEEVFLYLQGYLTDVALGKQRFIKWQK